MQAALNLGAPLIFGIAALAIWQAVVSIRQVPDYILPGPAEVPEFRVFHMQTPSPFTAFGIKGMGEGGAIAPPATICNAVNDALRPLGAELCETPLSPHRVLAAIAAGARHRMPPSEEPSI